MNKKKNLLQLQPLCYNAPDIEAIIPVTSSFFCTSPEDGGIESVGYEDWVVSNSTEEI